jgi:transforming growth factor-beta-induced protein
MNNRIDILNSFRKSLFLLKSGWKFLLITIIIMISLSCNSDDIDSVGEASTEQINIRPLGTAESVSEIFLDNGFTEFSQALQYVNEELYTALVEKFSTGADQHTVFVPTNEAFFKLYECLGMKTKDISEINNPGLVRDILLYHVVIARLPLDSLFVNNQDRQVKTFYGESLTIKSDGSIESIVNSSFIDLNESNILASNGVVHVINDVLLPIEITCADDAN